MSIIRSDSRTEADVRPLTMRMSVLSRADGSGQFSFGDLKALGAVTGPAEVRLRDERPTEAAVEVNVVPVGGPAGPSTKLLAHSIRCFFSGLILLNKYPRSLIQINLQTLSKPSNRWTRSFSTTAAAAGNSPPEPSPSPLPVGVFDETQSVAEKAALINAASLALLDAGVAMRGCGFAVAVALVPASAVQPLLHHQPLLGDQVVLDPSPYEESCASSLHLLGFHFGSEFHPPSAAPSEPNAGLVTLCESNGALTYEQLQTVLNYASLATRQILAFARRSCESVYQPDALTTTTTTTIQPSHHPSTATTPTTTTSEQLLPPPSADLLNAAAEEKRKRKKSKKLK